MIVQKENASVLLMMDYSLDYLGGAQTAFLRQVEALLGEGWSVTVVAPKAGKALQAKKSPLLKIIEPHVLFNLPGAQLPVLASVKKLEKRLEGLLFEGEISALIVHSEFVLAGIAARLSAKTGLPFLQTVHTFFWRAPRWLSLFAPLVTFFHTRLTGFARQPVYRGSTIINNALRSMTLRSAMNANLVLSPSKHQAEALVNAGLRQTRVLSNVVQPVKTLHEETNGQTFRLAWVGRFAPEKNLDLALAAFAEARSENPRLELHVAGGDLPEQSGVVSHGRVSSEEVQKIITASDALLLTSNGFDNQPMSALEAFALGKPVLLVDSVLKNEFEEAVLLAAESSSGALADLITEVSQNRQLLGRAGEAAVQYAETRGAKMHAKALLTLISELDLVK